MKKSILILFGLLVWASHIMAQHNNSELPTSINEDGTAPDASAILDIQSTTKGMLVPRMTTAQRTAVASPATGLLVFDTDNASFWFYDGTAWADLSSGGGADTDWTTTATGIYHNTGNVSVNTTSIDDNSNLYAHRPLNDYGADKAAIYGYRTGYASTPDSGGISFGYQGVDAAIKGFSNWGNAFSSGVAGHSYLDYPNSAAILGGQRTGLPFGALGFRDTTQVWAGYFHGDTRFRPAAPIVTDTAELYLDIVREFVDQGEFGKWHELYVLPNSRNVNLPHYDFYYLGDPTHHFDALYGNAIDPESTLLINGTTVITGPNELGIGTGSINMKLHIKQDIGNRGIRTEHQSTTDYWDTGIGTNTNNYKFYFNGLTRADIASTDGAYTQTSDASLKKNIESLKPVLDKVMALNPAKYHYTDAESTSQKSHGFIAQEVETVFPELIRQREDGKKALAYDDFAVLAIKAIQEQQVLLEEQNELLQQQQKELNEFRTMIHALQNQEK